MAAADERGGGAARSPASVQGNRVAGAKAGERAGAGSADAAPSPAKARGLFVAGTDTGVGKTVVAAAIAAALRARGERVAVFKPVLTGTDEPRDPDWPPDDELLAAAAGADAAGVAAERFGPPVSPHLAAKLAGRPLDPAALRAAYTEHAADADAVVVEGVGGLLVPLTDTYSVRDFARDLALPLVIAARPGLGTINHTLLTLEAARAADLRIAGVVITPWPDHPTTMEQNNLDTIARLGETDVATLPHLATADPVLLAQVGAALPLDRWVANS
jgi:dethiobiotin synthetase